MLKAKYGFQRRGHIPKEEGLKFPGHVPVRTILRLLWTNKKRLPFDALGVTEFICNIRPLKEAGRKH
jgi:hypothetical protein